MTEGTNPFRFADTFGTSIAGTPDDAPVDGFSSRITPWTKNRVKPEKTSRHALIMPGIGYTVDRPLLYWATQALAQEGWFVTRLEISLDHRLGIPRTAAALGEALDEWAEKARDVASASGEPDLLIVAKSLSTFTYPKAARAGIRAVLLTPVLSPAPLDPTGSVIPVPGDVGYLGGVSPEPLICSGSADKLFDETRARRLSDDVHVYPGGNHSIEIPDDWATSIDYLKDVTGQVVRYAAQGPQGES